MPTPSEEDILRPRTWPLPAKPNTPCRPGHRTAHRRPEPTRSIASGDAPPMPITATPAHARLEATRLGAHLAVTEPTGPGTAYDRRVEAIAAA